MNDKFETGKLCPLIVSQLLIILNCLNNYSTQLKPKTLFELPFVTCRTKPRRSHSNVKKILSSAEE